MNAGYGIDEDISEDYILKYLSQREIFEHFLNIEVQTEEKFCSPLRYDNHPTCNFNWYNGKLWFRDWSESKPKDCFTIVKELYNCNFFEALLIIKREMILDEGGGKEPRKKTEQELETVKTPKKKSKIQVQFGKWHPTLVEYLQQYGITGEQCKKFNIFAPKKVWLNGKLNWTYSQKDPALAYFFGKADNGDQRWKIYFFKRDEYRFLCNTNRINGWIQIPKTGKDLIITKSLKDVVCLDTLGYPAVAMQNETTEPYDYIVEELQGRFETVWSFYDFDRAGVRLANILKRKYELPYIFLTNGKYNTTDYGSKDISDYIKGNSIEEAEEFLHQCIPPF